MIMNSAKLYEQPLIVTTNLNTVTKSEVNPQLKSKKSVESLTFPKSFWGKFFELNSISQNNSNNNNKETMLNVTMKKIKKIFTLFEMRRQSFQIFQTVHQEKIKKLLYM